MRRQRLLLFISAIASVALWTYACGDGTTEPPRYFPEPTTVTVSPAATELAALDATVQLSAEVEDQQGWVMAGATVTWASSATAVATVDATGLVTAVGNGTATITATAGEASGSAAVTVAQVVSSVTVAPAEANFAALSDTLRLTAEAFDANGHAVAGAELSWETSDDAVATVDATGLLTTVANGTTTITATAGEAAGSATVTVAQVVSSVTVAPAEANFAALGDTLRLAAEALDANGHAVAGAEFSWESSDSTVATVDASGLVTTMARGSVTITATSGSVSGSAVVSIAQVVRTVAVTPDTATVVEGDTLRVAATATDANGQAVAEVQFAWASGDTAVAVVDASGLVTAVGTGQAEVTATVAGVTGRTQLTVLAPVPTTIAVTPDTVVLTALGHTAQLTAEVRDQAGRAMEEIPVAWSSADTTVAVVDPAGLVRAVRGGSVTVTATAGEASGSAHVAVRQSAGSVTVSPSADTVSPGDTLRLIAEAYDESGHVVDGAVFTWSSSDAPVATVDPSGLVRGAGEGTATITATAGDVSGMSEITVVNPDRAALVALYNATDGPNWVDNTNWLTDAPLGEWYGVSTDGAGRVVGINLAGRYDYEAREYVLHGLRGELPAELANLTNLTSLSLWRNDLSGPIPPELGGLASLESLNLSGNGFSGSIPPELGDLASLEFLNLGSNSLTGSIPPELGGLASLESLNLSGNGFSGSIPPELGDLASLEFLSLGSNSLTGSIPPELGGLASLEVLGLSGNRFSGSIPPELGDLANLEWLNLDRNELDGRIPAELGKLANLTDLFLGGGPQGFGGNDLTGPIPPELANLTKLRRLWLGNNDLSGPIPKELGNLASLTQLSLGGNDLTGPIPPELGDLASLEAMALWHNDLTGPIPPELGRLASLTSLSLNANSLDGPVPPELGGLANLTEMYLWGNNLSGPVPSSFLQLSQLRVFRFIYTELCTPGTMAFVEWLRNKQLDRGPANCNALDVDVLTSLHEGTGGTAWADNGGWLENQALENWYGVTADSLGRVTTLDLTRNGLTGQLPSQLGDLSRMRGLRIGGNPLTGRLPLSLARLPLHELHYEDTQLCAPAEADFQTWLNAVASHQGIGVECTPVSDRDVLETFYRATNGRDWIDSENWLTDAPLNEWYGVETDASGRVTGLQLAARWDRGSGSWIRHGLKGGIPPELTHLESLRWLDLGSNDLTGAIPPELGGLESLESLDLSSNDFSGPIPPELGDLESLDSLDLSGNSLSGPIPPELASLGSLRSLRLNKNDLSGLLPPELGGLASLRELWLAQNIFSGQIPPELGGLASLRELWLAASGISGPIPPELGGLESLESLELSFNRLSGPIPPELGGLASLRTLHLLYNRFSGSIPPELANLGSLTWLSLGTNDLTGPIPPELGGLASLRTLHLYENGFSGSIPPELANLASLNFLNLSSNNLTGPIPPELGDLANLVRLNLNTNDLAGPVPFQVGRLSRLSELDLSNNMALVGALPVELTDLSRIETIFAGGTGLCAPKNPVFETWLAGIREQWIARCADVASADAYLTQAVQSREFPVPLVAGDEALLRVFVTAVRATDVGIPDVRARFYRDGREIHSVTKPGTSAPIPTEVTEGELAASANAEIPGHVIQPGLEMVIEVDPDGTLDPELGVARRIPETGRLGVDIETMPLFDLTLIPFVWSETQDSSIVDLVRAMAADSENHDMLEDTRTLLPVGDLAVTAHLPVVSTSNSAFDLLRQTEAIRVIEGGNGHYKGMMAWSCPAMTDTFPLGSTKEVSHGGKKTRAVSARVQGAYRRAGESRA